MNIPFAIRTDADLKQRFSLRFYERWTRLLRAYSERKKSLGGVNVLKVASVALAFVGAAQEGDSHRVEHFDDMIHGYGTVLEIGGEPWVVGKDDVQATLMWDTACLMLEEGNVEQFGQRAYDVAGQHEYLAYDKMVMWQEEPSMPNKPAVVTEVKTVNNQVPKMEDDMALWIMQEAVDSGDPQRIQYARDLITSNYMSHYHNSLYTKLKAIEASGKRKQAPYINEYVANKTVQNEFGTIQAGGVGINNDPTKIKTV